MWQEELPGSQCPWPPVSLATVASPLWPLQREGGRAVDTSPAHGLISAELLLPAAPTLPCLGPRPFKYSSMRTEKTRDKQRPLGRQSIYFITKRQIQESLYLSPSALCKCRHAHLSVFPSCAFAQAASGSVPRAAAAFSPLCLASAQSLSIGHRCSLLHPGNSRRRTSRDSLPWPRAAVTPAHIPRGQLGCDKPLVSRGSGITPGAAAGELEPVQGLELTHLVTGESSRNTGCSCEERCSQGPPFPAP